MRDQRGDIDWRRTQEIAAGMDTWQLLGAIRDCLDTLPSADDCDREREYAKQWQHPSQGGYYRDCISVYRAEIARRRDG